MVTGASRAGDAAECGALRLGLGGSGDIRRTQDERSGPRRTRDERRSQVRRHSPRARQQRAVTTGAPEQADAVGDGATSCGLCSDGPQLGRPAQAGTPAPGGARRRSRVSTTRNKPNSRDHHKSGSSSSSEDEDVLAISVPSPAISDNSGCPSTSSYHEQENVQEEYLVGKVVVVVEVEDTWIHETLDTEINSLMQPAYIKKNTEEWEWYQFYEQYVDDDILNTCTNRKRVLETGKSMRLTLKELKVYIDIIMIMSALHYPQISIRMSCRTDEQDFPQEMSIDEMIIRCTGKYPMRQYCPNKPNPVGVFVLASPKRYSLRRGSISGRHYIP
ncbi:hypothetical protein EVAR_98961_1 [Eumeta japonica]|uniref:PiggyBac transposable element-derived protein domain-containing protein n=1 Tax=Eumeta variegata TaxID=151549 RepID=A0A4C1YMY0_EUMVA|nr:hypothetical protein EVAR_98961_1 [Eumeta japonica]